jgi:hypothetical protein
MNPLKELKANFTYFELSLLDFLGNEYMESGRAVTEQLVYRKWPRADVDQATNHLGGKVVQRGYYDGNPGFRITLLGLFLHTNGEDYVKLLARCLETVRRYWEARPDFRHIEGADIGTGGGFSLDDLRTLGRILTIAHGSGVPLTANYIAGDLVWMANPGDRIDELRDAVDLKAYIENAVTKDYRADYPVAEGARMSLELFGRPAQNDWQAIFGTANSMEATAQLPLRFVQDATLLKIAQSDWIEAETAFKGKAFKACIIICGALLETLFLAKVEALLAQGVITALPKPVAKLGLNDLDNLVRESKVLPPVTEGLTEFLRNYRNFVHPDAQRRANTFAGEHLAKIAMISVQWAAEEFSKQVP